ncbi:hypothetical protein LTR85_001202 [Meristemomyces frigidus]|nr:hypothetical protein LTR85_001202 [Meristemomyces frigidus]
MSRIMHAKATQQPNGIRDIILQYVGQLCNGCGNAVCTESMCDTGRRNKSPPNKPIRKWTPRSARAIAIALASRPYPRKYLCAFYSGEVKRVSAASDEAGGADGQHDPSSFTQLLCDTPSIRQLCSAAQPVPVPVKPRAYESLSRALDPLLTTLPVEAALQQRDSFVSNAQAADILFAALKALLDDFPRANPAQWGYAETFVDRGCAYPDRKVDAPTDLKVNVWLSLLDRLEYGPAVRLLGKTLHALALRTQLEQDLDDLKRDVGVSGPQIGNAHCIMNMLFNRITQADWDTPAWLAALIISLKKTFLLHWGGVSTTVARGSAACGALELLGALHTAFVSRNLRNFVLPVVAMYLDAVDLAESWMSADGNAGSRHLLSFSFLFGPKERAMYFRTINHLKMRQAHSLADKAAELRRRAVPHTLDDEPEGKLRYAEEHYLLLNVSRGNLLRDAYDQLWQRREGELFRPLRVRLGEVEELEVGHDLGGVQIEFFNLVCKEAFSEEAQMFTTDPKTGLSYFRPGSLQPLYMFELLGLLMALAIYNGITLPVSLPKVFYKVLPSQNRSELVAGSHLCDIDKTDGAAAIRDGWPAESRSLSSILYEDVADLEYSFPLEANGLRMSVHPPNRDKSDERRTLEVISATGDLTHSLDTSEGIRWPGWRLVKSTREPESVTAENKTQYVADYVRWLIWYSVEPQWLAFRGGFRRVIDDHSLSIFTPDSLKSFVEGSSRLDVNDLRKATKYDGYDAKSKYIQNYWRIVASWPEAKQKQLLKFVTAAERVPIGGASNLTFVISRSVVEDLEHLPTSSTCFGTLYLPRYATAEVLNEKLSLAIKYGLEGFGTG